MIMTIKPIFSSNITRHIFLGLMDPNGPFPSKILAHSFSYSDTPIEYVPLINAQAIVTLDDDGIIGHCTCSSCENSVDLFDGYCSHCGAKLKERKLQGDKNA